MTFFNKSVVKNLKIDDDTYHIYSGRSSATTALPNSTGSSSEASGRSEPMTDTAVDKDTAPSAGAAIAVSGVGLTQALPVSAAATLMTTAAAAGLGASATITQNGTVAITAAPSKMKLFSLFEKILNLFREGSGN